MKLLLVIAATFCCTYAFGQDLLYTKNRGLLKVRVTEISDAFIKYRLFDMEDGPVYTTTRRLIDSIVYQNGMVEKFSVPSKYNRHNRFDKGDLLKDASTDQLSGGMQIIGTSPVYSGFNGDERLKNPYAVGVYIKYQKEILRKRVGIYVAPFIGFNTKAYGTTAGAKFNIKRFGRVTIGIGPEYILNYKDIVEEFYSNAEETGSFTYFKKYRSAVSAVNFNANMNLYVKPNLSVTADAGVGGVVGSSKRKENMLSKNDGIYSGNSVSFRLGIGYWF